ncbi:MAG TPA: substrate-binding domain-containing protein [Candidatus Kapabacteria bacterium]|nr:substrate-binding domain-containing protein [Candidatus Kapabacteria bacterium]
MTKTGIRFAILLICVAIVACTGNKQSQPQDSPSEGSLTIYCDEYVMPLMTKEVEAYDSIYPNVHLTLVPTTARDAVVQLLSGKTKLSILGRAFTDEERKLIEKYHLPVGEYEVAKDAMAVIVNRANPLDTIRLSTLKMILLPKDTLKAASISWRSFGGKYDKLVSTVVPAPASSVYGYIIDQITNEQLKSANIVCDSAEKVVSAVREYPGAIGFTDWDCVASDTTVKVLRIAGVDSSGAQEKFVMLHPAYIYLKKYPLLHSVWGYTTEGRPALAKGFMAFVCNADGQRLALEQKLVPVTQIIRLKEPD